MIQVSKILPPVHETDYSKIDGPTGPLVYPAVHVWIHRLLYHLTDRGSDVRLAQYIYAGLYLTTLSLVLACYRRVGAPPWLLVPLVLSKRLHSIFLLRTFNDAWAALFFWSMTHAATRKQWFMATMAWSLGLGTKMSLLLPLPGLAILLAQGTGPWRALAYGFAACIVQLGSATPFLGHGHAQRYLNRAFQLDRVFLYKWTVNWRMLDETVFLSKSFSYLLLTTHASLLLAFIRVRLIKPCSRTVPQFVRKMLVYNSLPQTERQAVARNVTPRFCMDALLGTMVIGLLCARSLHYQFYAYLVWCTPYLLWRAQYSALSVSVIWLAQEVAWNVYPASALSSTIVVVALALQVMALFSRELRDTHHLRVIESGTKKHLS